MIIRSMVTAAIMAGAGFSARAATYSFKCLTNSNAGNCGDGEASLSMSITDAGAGRVDFKFTNNSLVNSSITEIYFDDGTLLGIASVTDSGAGVVFSQIGTANPANLPGAANVTPSFQATQGFVVDTGNGGPSKGVEHKLDSGVWEFVTIRFNLINGKSFADTLNAMNGPLGDGNDLRVGLHVKSFSGGGSESFISAVPEPAGFVFPALGLGLLGAMTRARKKTV